MRIGDFEKLSFFESAILNFFFEFFLFHPNGNQSTFIGFFEGFFEILMITLVYSPKQHLPKDMQHSVYLCQPAQNQPKSQILFLKNSSLRNLYLMTLCAVIILDIAEKLLWLKLREGRL